MTQQNKTKGYLQWTFVVFLLMFLIYSYAMAEDNCKRECDNECAVYTDPMQNENCRKTCEENEEKCEKLNKKVKTYEEILKINNKTQNTIQQQLKELEDRQNKNQQETQIVKNNLEKLSAKIEILKKEIIEKEKLIEQQKKLLAGLMRSYYDYYQQGLLSIVLSGKDLAESLSQADYIEQSGAKANEVLDEIKKAQRELEESQKQLEEDYSKSEELKSKLQYEQGNLQATENQKQALLVKAQKEEEKYKELLASVQDEIYNLELGKTVDFGNIPPAKGGYFDYPVSTVKITQGYGMTSFAKSGAYGGKPHNGIDFGLASGNNIFAAKGGTVINTGNNGRYAYGKWIAVNHGDGLVTLYGHLSSQLVSKGDKVETGDKIGKSGNTGYSTGPHLHFSVFSSKSFELVESKYVKGLMIPIGASVNPMRYLK